MDNISAAIPVGLEPLPKRPKTHIEQSFTRRYAANVKGFEGHDLYFYLHPNSLCIVGITKPHPLVREILNQKQALNKRNKAVPAGQEQGAINALCEGQSRKKAVVDGPEGTMHMQAVEKKTVQRVEHSAQTNQTGEEPEGLLSLNQKSKRMKLAGLTIPGGQSPEPAPDLDLACQLMTEPPIDGPNSDDAHVEVDLSNEACLPSAKDSAATVGEPPDVLVDFNVGRSNRLDVRSNGRRRKGWQKNGGKSGGDIILQPDSTLCKVVVRGKEYTVPAGVRGKLLQVNARIAKDPYLIAERCQAEGHVAVLHLRKNDAEQLERSFLSAEDYAELRGLDVNELGVGSGL